MHLILTGATGYVGKHVLARLLGAGHRVSVIARSRNDSASRRVIAALLPFAATLPADWKRRLSVLDGDVTRASCGVDPATLTRLGAAGIDGFIHCAGLTRFESYLEDELFAQNLGGTRRAFALAEKLGSQRFHHVSTAFVAGDSTTPFGAAQLAIGQAFNNPYEASKFAAESFLHEAAAQATGRSLIYRPSIVVGGEPLGEGNAVSTVYTFIKAMDFLRECYRRDVARGRDRFTQHGLHEGPAGFHMPIRVAADPATPLYLVSIHALVESIVDHLDTAAGPVTTISLSGRAYPLGSLRDAFCAAMRITGPRLVAPDEFDNTPRNAVEAHFFRLTRSYQPYLLRAPRFDKAAPHGSPRIDLERLAYDFLTRMSNTNSEPAGPKVGAMAVGLHGIKRARDYFDGLTQSDIGRHFLGRHAFVDAAIRFRIRGGDDFDETIVFKGGRARYAAPEHEREYHCAYELDESLFLKVITGETDLRGAFFAGRVAIHGDKEIALKFGSLLSQYYRDIENNVIQEVAV